MNEFIQTAAALAITLGLVIFLCTKITDYINRGGRNDKKR